MQSHKMLLEDIYEDPFYLIAIYVSVDEYRMAYFLNKFLQLKLKREARDVDLTCKNFQAMYALYSYKDLNTYSTYHLVANKYKGEAIKILSSGSLFQEEEVRPQEVHLIPEYKKVDFFLKIEEGIDDKQFKVLVNKINQISQVQAAHAVNIEELKSKQNLIFE